MSKKGKWIGGLLGWAASGPIGALFGVLIGAVVDRCVDAAASANEDTQAPGGAGPRSRYSYGEQRNSFMLSFLVLSSAVIRADGKTKDEELRTVRDFIRTNFGEQACEEAMDILQSLSAQQINIYGVCAQIRANMNYSQRLQLLHYLIRIAVSDGSFSKEEKSVIETIASSLGLNSADCASLFAMYWRDSEDAYAVLEISPSASDDEVKSAYRRMAMKNHPDKVASLGPDVRKAAEEKFLKIRDAYETIKRERGIQ